jgi:hypothetical protein
MRRVIAFTLSTVFVTAAYGCKSDRVHPEVSTHGTIASAPQVVDPGPVAKTEPAPALENSRSDYNIDVTAARAHAEFASTGSGSLRGVAAIIGDKLVVQVAEAKPGKYTVNLNEGTGCIEPSSAARIAQNQGTGTNDLARGDMVLGMLNVGTDGRGRVEAALSEDIWREGTPSGTLVIRSEDNVDTSAGELRSPIACGEISTGEKGA